MAVAVFITASRSKNFSIAELARAPVVAAGNIDGAIGQIVLPSWYPVQDALCRTGDDSIYCRMADLPLAREVKRIDQNNSRLLLDFRPVSHQPLSTTFSLTYFPWFRFLSEPINFDAVGRVAAYVGDCFSFLLKKCGFETTLSQTSDTCTLRSTIGIEIQVTGMNALNQISITYGDNVTCFDFANKRIMVNEMMFASAYQAVDQILTTGDALTNVRIEKRDRHVMLQYMPEASNV